MGSRLLSAFTNCLLCVRYLAVYVQVSIFTLRLLSEKKKVKKINQIFNIAPFYYQTSIIVQIVGSIYLELDWVPHH